MRGFLLMTVVVVLVGAAAAASAQNAAHRGDPRQGRSLAVQKCDVCHIVASNQQIPPLVPHHAPSFYDLASRPGATAESLEAFLAKPHPLGIMPYPELTTAQVADLVSYILSLRGRH
jgi:mono/diheme cytochrome c family protein